MSETIEENISEEPVEEPITKKDPKRVEQGKRLAAISKQAKKEKMRRKIQEENFSIFPYVMYSIAFLSTSGLIYMIFKTPEKDLYPQTIYVQKSPKKESPKKKETPKKKFENLN